MKISKRECRLLKNDSILQCNEAAFVAAGDYIIPVIKLQLVGEKRLGKYGIMRRAFLKEHDPILFDDLVLTEQFFRICMKCRR